MSQRWFSTFGASALGVLLGCGAVLEGHGPVLALPQPMGPFAAISIAGPIELKLQTGPEFEVLLRGQANLLPEVHVDVRDGVLLATPLPGLTLAPTEPLVLMVRAPTLRAVVLDTDSASSIGPFAGAEFVVEQHGTGRVQIDRINVDALYLRARDAGSMTARALTTHRLELESHDVATLTAQHLTGASARVQAMDQSRLHLDTARLHTLDGQSAAGSTLRFSALNADEVGLHARDASTVTMVGAADVLRLRQRAESTVDVRGMQVRTLDASFDQMDRVLLPPPSRSPAAHPGNDSPSAPDGPRGEDS